MTGELSNLKAPRGANRPRKHKGRGAATDGKTSGRGMKGQKARKSGHVRLGFEGGQMPLQRRLPKRGFKNPFAKNFQEVSLSKLNAFDSNELIDEAAMRRLGLVKGPADGVKILANGELIKAVKVKVNRISAAAKAKIEAAGGSVELIADRVKWERTDTRAKKRESKKKTA